MKITIITKYDPELCEHYCGAVTGSVDKKTRWELAKRFGCEPPVEPEPGSVTFPPLYEEDEKSQLFFREVELTTIDEISNLLNIDG